MKRICSGIALLAALGCSSENSEQRTPLESTAEKRDPHAPSGDGGVPSLPGADLPGKLAPTRETAGAVLARIAALYQDYAAAAEPQGTHRVTWKIRDDDTYPHIRANFGQDWEIQTTAAWLEYPMMTIDTLALSACHEMGHFVGGFPFKDKHPAQGTWSATEGQADYFSTKDCLPRLWADERVANAAAFAELEPSQQELCTKSYTDLQSQELCARLLTTSIQGAQIYLSTDVAQHPGMSSIEPKLETPDPSIVTATQTGDAHPPAQCRLDTLVAGTLCDVKNTGTTVPGYLPPYGQFSEASQEAARPFACQEGVGARPKCWFYPDTRETKKVEFDCAGFGNPRCDVVNEEPGIWLCDAESGPRFEPCMSTESCVDADGVPTCMPREEPSGP